MYNPKTMNVDHPAVVATKDAVRDIPDCSLGRFEFLEGVMFGVLSQYRSQMFDYTAAVTKDHVMFAIQWEPDQQFVMYPVD